MVDKYIFPVLFFLLCMAANAQFIDSGNSQNIDVNAILQNPREDMRVTLRGNILKKISHEHYLFSDGSGQIHLDIDDDYFPPGVPVTPDMLIEIRGKVDKRFLNSPEIEVQKMSDGSSAVSGATPPGVDD